MKSISELLSGGHAEVVDGYGRIMRARHLGAISFYVLYDQFSQIQIVDGETSKRSRKPGKGDLVTFRGAIIREGDKVEIHASKIDFISERPSDPGARDRAFDEYSIERDWVRARTTQVIHAFFASLDFMPVQSPSIVSNWVEGQTGSFSTQFYEEPASLSISNMLYHQILLTKRFSRIYELGKVFRMETPSSRHRLAEFTIIDIGMAWATVRDIQGIVQELVTRIHAATKLLPLKTATIPDTISFGHVAYDHILSAVGLSETTGSQLPSKAKRWLNEKFESFVWVNGFPRKTRPFFVRSVNEQCDDTQLWYRGKIYIAAGGARETCPDIARQKILDEGKNPARYADYLGALDLGSPPMVGIGMGIERFLATWIDPSCAADFNSFPRFRGHLEP